MYFQVKVCLTSFKKVRCLLHFVYYFVITYTAYTYAIKAPIIYFLTLTNLFQVPEGTVRIRTEGNICY